jgi:hypothetical protein
VDVWAIGCVTFEMLSGGYLPFEAADHAQRHLDVIT